MEDWIRRLAVLVIVGLWSLYVLVNGIIRHDPIPEAVWLVPSAAWVAFSPKFNFLNRRKDKDDVGSD